MKQTIICPKCAATIEVEVINGSVNVISHNHAENCSFNNPNLSTRQRARLEALAVASASGQLSGNFFAMKNGGSHEIAMKKDGETTILDEAQLDEIEKSLYVNGYVKNTRLFRRFVLPQMMRALEFVSCDGKKRGFTEWLHMKGYEYTWRAAVEELRILEKIRRSDPESYAERSRFFNRDVVVKMAEDYLTTLEAYIDKLKTRKCKGVPYKRIHGKDVFVKDIDSTIYAPVREAIKALKRSKEGAVARVAGILNKKRTLLHFDTPISPAFADAYKAAGAFYSLKNLIMFHNCVVTDEDGNKLTMYESLDYINRKADKCMAAGEGYKLLGFLKEFLVKNNFNYIERLKQLGVISA